MSRSRPQQEQHHPTSIVRALHVKGLLTILLMSLAETVQFANAISHEPLHDHNHNHHPGHQDHPDHPATAIHGRGVAAAAAATGRSPGDSQTCDPLESGWYELCRADLSQGATAATRLVPRGGHSHVAAVARETLTAVTATTPFHLPLTVWKIGFQIALTLLNIICWMIPLYSTNISSTSLSYMNAFSGGVFLTLAFCHLIPECAHDFVDSHSILPYACVLFGYLLIFFVEKIAFGEAHEMLHVQNDDQQLINGHKITHPPHHSHSHQHNHQHNIQAIADSKTAANALGGTSPGGNSAVILLAALSVHSILEMMALGLARSFTDAAVLTGSIALHQPAESIALLIAFLKTGKSRREILSFLTAFSIMGPIGVGLGILVQEYAPSQFDTVVLAIVAGTFVYVGATEVIPEEFDHNGENSNKFKKFGFLMLGVAAILGITQYTMSGHQH